MSGCAASMNKTITTGLRPKEKQPPLVAGATTFPPQAVGQQPVLNVKLLLKEMLFRALLCPRTAGKRWCRKAPKGEKPPEAANSPECGSCLCIKPLQPSWLRENHTTAPAGEGKNPLWWLRHHLCPGGKRVTGFSVVCRLPTARLSPTHWILRSLPLPYESSSLV